MLYISVIAAVILGCIVGLVAPDFAKALAPIGTAFISLIKMMIAPVIFCTIVLGVGSVAKAATVGKVGGMALLYFILMSTFALGIGLVVGNLIEPGHNLHYQPTGYKAPTVAGAEQAEGHRWVLAQHYSHFPTFLANRRKHFADPLCGATHWLRASAHG